jgi:hypothetical protein
MNPAKATSAINPKKNLPVRDESAFMLMPPVD